MSASGARSPSDADLVRLKAKPNFRALGKKFGKRTQEAAAAVAALGVEAALRRLEEGAERRRSIGTNLGGCVGRRKAAVEREVTSDWLVAERRPICRGARPRGDHRRAAGPRAWRARW